MKTTGRGWAELRRILLESGNGLLPSSLWGELLPCLCHGCGRPIANGEAAWPRCEILCGDCRARLRPETNDMRLAGGLPLFSAFKPDPLLLGLIKGWKYSGRDGPLRFFQAGLRRRLAEEELPRPLCFVPVPLPPQRRLQRGFNQSEQLARGLLAGETDCKLSFPLRRRLWAGKQAGRSREERLSRATREYRLRRSPSPLRRILLLDDVCTTGATLQACAALLREAGAEPLGALVLTRIAPPRGRSFVDSDRDA